MIFLSRDEARVLEKKLRRQIAERPSPKVVLYYDSGPRDYSIAANAIARSSGGFSEATLIFLFCIGGDGWDEHSAKDPRWIRYRRWRAANNEDRRLYEARMRSNSLRRASNLPWSLAGTLWSQQSPDASCCSFHATIGWRSIEASMAECLPGN